MEPASQDQLIFFQTGHLFSSTNNHLITDRPPLAKDTLPTEKLCKLSQNNAGLQGTSSSSKQEDKPVPPPDCPHTEGSCPVSCPNPICSNYARVLPCHEAP